MARPKSTPDAVPTHERILAAAAVEFSTVGFDQAKLEDIADAVGIRRPSLLYHFESKASLYSAVVEQVFEQLGAALELPMRTEGEFEERLHALVEGFVVFVDDHPEVAGIMVREIVTPQGPGQELLARHGELLLSAVERWLREFGGPKVRANINLRRALLQVVSEALLRNASGPTLAGLWGSASSGDSWRLARVMLLNVKENS